MVESDGVESHRVESHRVESEKVSSADVASQAAVPTGIYRHHKGNLYEVIGTATHSETGESLVVYRAHYGEFGLWVRPREMFLDQVEVGGHNVRRFGLVEG